MAKPAHYGAKRARGTSFKKGIFPIALTREIPRVKCAETAKIAEHWCNSGRISRQPYVRSLRDKHERDENRVGWRIECRLWISTRHVQR